MTAALLLVLVAGLAAVAWYVPRKAQMRVSAEILAKHQTASRASTPLETRATQPLARTES